MSTAIKSLTALLITSACAAVLSGCCPEKTPVHALGTCQWNRKTIRHYEVGFASSTKETPSNSAPKGAARYSLEAHFAFPLPPSTTLSALPATFDPLTLKPCDSSTLTQVEREVLTTVLEGFGDGKPTGWVIRQFTDTNNSGPHTVIELSADIEIYRRGDKTDDEIEQYWARIERVVHHNDKLKDSDKADSDLKKHVLSRLDRAPGAAAILGFQ